jgi:hypothetical protein
MKLDNYEKHSLPKVTMCIIALFTLILPASAQNTNATDEYKET